MSRRFSRRFLAAALLMACAPQLSGQTKTARIDSLVRQSYQDSAFSGSVLVAYQGKVIYRGAFGQANAEWRVPNTVDTKFRIGSITKQFTAMLILQLVEEGKLRLDGTISDYLPDYPAETGRRVTIQQLLTHTSGIPSYTDAPDFFPKRSRDPSTPSEFLKTFSGLPLSFEPGSQFHYDNSGFFLLGAIIERVTGKPYDQVLQQRILTPLGLKDTGYDWNTPLLPKRASAYEMGFDGLRNAPYIDMSLPYAAGAMYSTVEDLWRWDQALAAGKLLSTDSYREYQTPRVATDFGGQYAFGWLIQRVDRGPGRDSATVIWHGGGINGFRAMNYRVPEDGIAIIWLDNTTQGPQLQEPIARILYGLPYDPPRSSIARAIYPTIKQTGGASGVALYRKLRQAKPAAYDVSENELNLLGYHLLGQGRTADAIQVFALNVEQYPQSFNTYDSLGEAFLAAGDTTQAVTNYRRSVELNPENTAGAEVLRKLEAR